jgi:hypothetical protein
MNNSLWRYLKMTQKQRYDLNPKFCVNCGEKILFKQNLSSTMKRKYCSLGCAASDGNKRHLSGRKKNYKPEVWRSRIEKAIADTKSMAAAAFSLNLEFKTFRSMAKELGVYAPNPGGRGTSKSKYPIEDVFSNKVYVRPQDLRKRLVILGIKEEKCERCEISDWRGQKAPLELHHIDGVRENNALNNIEILCPNCHAQTDNYKGKNKKASRGRR